MFALHTGDKNTLIIKLALPSNFPERPGMDTIAEGVETDAQLQFLKQMGCNYGQGYLISRPVDVEAITKLLRQNQDQSLNGSESQATSGWIISAV
jgi:sensor c-di-GMP phosphodiesterase-like protein